MFIFFFFMISLLSKHTFILCGHHKISITAIFPREDNRIIYRTTDFVKLMCHAIEVFPGRGFSSGASIAEKWALEIFWGKYLKLTRFSDRYIP